MRELVVATAWKDDDVDVVVGAEDGDGKMSRVEGEASDFKKNGFP